MSGPIVFISHFQVKEGKLEDVRALSREVTERLRVEKPRTLVYLSYTDESGTRATFVHVFADAESMDLHVQGAEERAKAAYEYVDPDGWEIYGRPSEPVLEMMRRSATSAGVTLSVQPDDLAGFLRLRAD